MKLGHTNDEIKFDGIDGTAARYLVILDSQPTMTILCDTADPEKIIKISCPKVAPQATNGRFAMVTELLSDSDGMPLGVGEARVDEKSVYTYVIPRLHVLLGRLLRNA